MKLLLFILFLFCLPLQAHQPKLINYSPTIDNPHAVIFPEISKAFGEKINQVYRIPFLHILFLVSKLFDILEQPFVG